MTICSPSLVPSSATSSGASSAKAEAVAERPTQSGTTAFARSACASTASDSAAACSVTAATSLPRETAVLPTYSALSPMAAESAAMLGTMSSTSLTGSSHGALAEMRTVEVSTSSSTLVSCDLEEIRVRLRVRGRVSCSRHRQDHYGHPTSEGELRPPYLGG